MTSASETTPHDPDALRAEFDDLNQRLLIAWAHRHDGWPLSPARIRRVREYYRVGAEARRFGNAHPELIEAYLAELDAKEAAGKVAA